MLKQHSKNSNGYLVGDDGILRYIPSGVTRASTKRAWRISFYNENGFLKRPCFFDISYGGIEQSYQAAIEYLREVSERVDTFSTAFQHRYGRRIVELQQMSILFEDRNHLPMGIRYIEENSYYKIIASAPDGRCLVRNVRYNDLSSWEVVVSDLRDWRLNILIDRAEQKRNIALKAMGM